MQKARAFSHSSSLLIPILEKNTTSMQAKKIIIDKNRKYQVVPLLIKRGEKLGGFAALSFSGRFLFE
ncbi:MAG: hypothetical protein LBD50_03670 [Rickettsiales bacterium]|jgi:hypothetical protein|nr:hypothetical protein [Rickettsiales bacterium]